MNFQMESKGSARFGLRLKLPTNPTNLHEFVLIRGVRVFQRFENYSLLINDMVYALTGAQPGDANRLG